MCISMLVLVAILPVESANCMQSSEGCNTAGRTKIKLNMEAPFRNRFTFCDPYCILTIVYPIIAF